MVQVASQIKKTYDKGCKIALVRDLALQLGCDADLVADIQKHYEFEKLKLNHIKEGLR